jgi:hypothetical protein
MREKVAYAPSTCEGSACRSQNRGQEEKGFGVESGRSEATPLPRLWWSSNGIGDGGYGACPFKRNPISSSDWPPSTRSCPRRDGWHRGREDFAKECHESVRLWGRTARGPSLSPALALTSFGGMGRTHSLRSTEFGSRSSSSDGNHPKIVRKVLSIIRSVGCSRGKYYIDERAWRDI